MRVARNFLEIIGQRVELRKSGKEYVGRCPFHEDKTPSFSVNEEKGLFHCHGCHVGGDVINFIELIEGIGFKEALKRLGIDNNRPPRWRKNESIQRASAKLANWLNDQHLKVGVLLRELSVQIAIAQEIPDPEVKESLECEWDILSDFHADLQRAEFAEEFLEAKPSIEAITVLAPVEPLPEFPEWPQEYEEYLAVRLPEVPAC
jgi:hypothetical protein